MNLLPDGSGLEHEHLDRLALNDLLEVEACLREMLQTTSDPAVLQRLFNLHREIQRYVAELTGQKS